MFLPASNEVAIKDLPEETPSLDQMLKGSETVLLVDDEQEVLNVGKNFLEKLENLLHQGCHGFIQKSFSLHEFSKVIRTILDKRIP